MKSVAIDAGINDGMLYQWVQKYKTMGYNGLVAKRKGRPGKEPHRKKKMEPEVLTESEREELIRLSSSIYISEKHSKTVILSSLCQEKLIATITALWRHSSDE